jgi:hypothetical protein
MPLVIRTPMALEIDRRDLPNRVRTLWVIVIFGEAVIQVILAR